MNRTITLLHAVMLCGLSAALHAQGPEATVLQGATILTVSKGTIENGSLVIRGGKIAAVGPNLAVPKGARVIDATGRYVLPGIIDCHSHMAIHVGNESGVPVTSMVSIEDVLEPEDITIYRALSGGVTTANILHGSSNPISASAARSMIETSVTEIPPQSRHRHRFPADAGGEHSARCNETYRRPARSPAEEVKDPAGRRPLPGRPRQGRGSES